LTGFTGSGPGTDAFTVSTTGGTISDVRFSDANGDPLAGDDSGLLTLDGNGIFLYTDTNNNIVLGREGTGTTADPNGDIVFGLYIEETTDPVTSEITGGKIWVSLFEAISHPDATDPDDAVDLTNRVFVTSSEHLQFDVSNAPSGQNLFIMFGDGNITDGDAEVGIVATGEFPANESEGVNISTGDTVNTSQAGGPTTFAINNQLINEGEGIYFTFVTGPNPDYTVPNLTQTEANIEANTQFSGFMGSRGAEFEVVQLQSGKTAVLTLTAYEETAAAADASGANFVDELNDANDVQVDITSVEVIDLDGGGEIDIIDNGDGTFTIAGVEAGDTIQYTTGVDHNRILITNTGDGTGQDSAAFDIGGFELLQLVSDTAEIGSKVNFEDAGPAITVTTVAPADALEVDETDLGIDATAAFADNFSNTPDYGADGAGSIGSGYALSVRTCCSPSTAAWSRVARPSATCWCLR
jgi:hypothetical protein